MEIRNQDIRERANLREIYRYLGYGTRTPDDNIAAMIVEVLDSLSNMIQPKNIYKIYPCSISENIVVLKGEKRALAFESRNLADNLAQCRSVILIAATLGLEADKLLQKYEILNMTKATIAQACGAACIEAYCNILQEQICEEVSTDERKLYLRPRFSPGYGDLPLRYQKVIFEELECTKRIGLTLTDSLLMYPTKSVSALIGLTANPQSCHIGKCKNCDNTECEFRET
ncbi:MAG: Vitamin B12 dependent methionine synthase activation subunit [Lachnospiraceae bacterium]|nr:Vitamin B12 dependent methionine synthase activation subunit [Lachnospiraceae bacterium]